MEIGLYVVLGSVLLVVVEAVFSYRNNSFFPSQVMAKWGKHGKAFFAHGGIWGDLLLLPPLMWFIVLKYGESWNIKQIALMSVIGIAVTLANHLLLIFTSNTPDPLGWKKEKISVVIVLHFVYMSLYIALVGMFYFFSGVDTTTVVIVSVVLGIHTTFGTHIVLGIINRWKQWSWCPDFLGDPNMPRMQAVIWVALACLAWVAAGGQAGLTVALIGASFAIILIVLMRVSPSPNRPHS